MNNSKKFLFRPRFWAVMLVVVFFAAEVGVRTLGLMDFPLYEANAKIGYIPSANQHGSFLNKNSWEVNALHMGAGEFKPVRGPNVLLIGDSLVYGGNPLGMQDRLGSNLQALMQSDKGAVWPISAGSWALRNELAYLRLYPQVLSQVDQVIFLLNSGDFEAASSWACELNHPRTHPKVALWYLFNKYVRSFEPCGASPASLQVPPGDLRQELTAYMAVNAEKTSFALYPDIQEIDNPSLELAKFEAGRALLIDSGARNVMRVSADGRWNSKYYRDGIHPTAEGNRVLASILMTLVKSSKQ